MEKMSSILRHFQASRGKKNRPEIFMEWPFFLILTVVLGFVYIQSILSNAALREPVLFILFTILMVVHIALHWLSVRLQRNSHVVVYVVVQSALAFVVVYLAANIGLLLGLYIGLIGETIGLLREKPRRMIAAVAVLLGLSFLNYILLGGWAGWYWWLLAMLPMTFFVAVYVTLYSRQAEARQQAQSLLADLGSANRQLTDYAARVEDLTIASERQRMARELHDTLSQGLAGLILQLEAADAHLAGNRPDRARVIVRETMVRARSTLADARRAIDDLRHPGKLGLGEAARLEAEHFIASTGIPCEVSISLPASLPDPVTESAVRAVTEGLTNIARHAQAKNAKLLIVTMEDENELEIEISDDGIGFNPQAVEAGHYGLLGMRERVRLTGGTLEITSKVGRGTQLVIRFPLEKHPDE